MTQTGYNTSLRDVNFDTRMNIHAKFNLIFFPGVCFKIIDLYMSKLLRV